MNASWFGGKKGVGVVPAEGADVALDVEPGSVRGGAVGEVLDAVWGSRGVEVG
jgi:hypothetical protein